MGMFTKRRQKSEAGHCPPLGSLMNQGGGGSQTSGDDLADLMQQGDTRKPGQRKNAGTGLRGLMGQ